MLFENEDLNVYIISIIWGLGIAAIFRKMCKNSKCIVIKAPKDILDYHQKKDDTCYKFIKHETDCN